MRAATANTESPTCKRCGERIEKFDRRILASEFKAEQWGDAGGRVAQLHTFDAGVFCGWECLGLYAAAHQAQVARAV